MAAIVVEGRNTTPIWYSKMVVRDPNIINARTYMQMNSRHLKVLLLFRRYVITALHAARI